MSLPWRSRCSSEDVLRPFQRLRFHHKHLSLPTPVAANVGITRYITTRIATSQWLMKSRGLMSWGCCWMGKQMNQCLANDSYDWISSFGKRQSSKASRAGRETSRWRGDKKELVYTQRSDDLKGDWLALDNFFFFYTSTSWEIRNNLR